MLDGVGWLKKASVSCSAALEVVACVCASVFSYAFLSVLILFWLTFAIKALSHRSSAVVRFFLQLFHSTDLCV